ncbi:MAG: hypothetical protein RQ751_05170 [Longimicrobiales bacterium]|nr:hypothetical protein [Longimicrobiales bacterium]
METHLEARREYAQLIRLHERLRLQLQRLRDDLDAPGTTKLLRELRRRVGLEPESQLGDVASSVEEALRALQLAEAAAQTALNGDGDETEVAGVENLPGRLARFLAERRENPDFGYRVLQDPVRGWVIRWKEYTEDGRIRGCGQFYERPYAWLDD